MAFSNADFQQFVVERLLKILDNFNQVKLLTLLKTHFVESLLKTIVENSVGYVGNFNIIKCVSAAGF